MEVLQESVDQRHRVSDRQEFCYLVSTVITLFFRPAYDIIIKSPVFSLPLSFRFLSCNARPGGNNGSEDSSVQSNYDYFTQSKCDPRSESAHFRTTIVCDLEHNMNVLDHREKIERQAATLNLFSCR